MANIVWAVRIASSNRPSAISVRKRTASARASARICCTSGSSREKPSVLSFSRICQSGWSSRAARSTSISTDRPYSCAAAAGNSFSGIASSVSRRSNASLSKRKLSRSMQHLK